MLLNSVIVIGHENTLKTRVDRVVTDIFKPQPVVSADLKTWSVASFKQDANVTNVMDLIRQQIKWLSLSAHNQLGIKVWLIYEADLLSQPAQNAMLKTLEEPLPGRYIILTAQSQNRLLNTILSRSQIIYADKTDKLAQTQGWLWLKKHLQLSYPNLQQLAYKLSVQGRPPIARFLQDCHRQLWEDQELADKQSQAARILAEAIKEIDNNLNLKTTLTDLFWQLKFRLK